MLKDSSELTSVVWYEASPSGEEEQGNPEGCTLSYTQKSQGPL